MPSCKCSPCIVQLVSIQDFRRATVDDVCAVHERSYVLGLEKLAQSGRVDIVDDAPTYITSTSCDDALQVKLNYLPRKARISFTARTALLSDNPLLKVLHSDSQVLPWVMYSAGCGCRNGTCGCCGGEQQRSAGCDGWLWHLSAPRSPCCAKGTHGLLPLWEHLHCCAACTAIPWAKARESDTPFCLRNRGYSPLIRADADKADAPSQGKIAISLEDRATLGRLGLESVVSLQVMVFDFDVHHGNGTNDVFYEDEDVLFVSTHQQGSYPGTGKLADAGSGSGEGTSINLPLPGGLGVIVLCYSTLLSKQWCIGEPMSPRTVEE